MKDLIILGNGMAGMTAALYAKRANLDFKIVGRDEYDFGQIANAVCVENFPCAAPLSGMDLAMKLHEQLIDNDIQIEEHTVTQILRFSDGNFSVYYEDGEVDIACSVIYALGASHRKLNCEIEEGIPIHYCAVCDGALYKDKTVAVIGGGDVAFTEAEYLSKICKQVIILMCDENVTAAASTFERVKNIDNIHIEYNFPVIAIKKINNHIALFSEEPGSTLSSWYGPRVDGIFVAIGMVPNTAPLKKIEDLDQNGCFWCWPNTLQSMTVAGLFGAGDVRVKNVRQAVTAAADGAIAVNSVVEYLKNH